MDNTIEFTRGDAADATFSIPATAWLPGGKLFFAAKLAIDDDNTDANSQINGEWGDDVVSDVTIDGVAYKRYACHFPPSATNSILSSGAGSATYLGEFQLVPATGIPVTFPRNDKKLQAIVYFDVKRKTVI